MNIYLILIVGTILGAFGGFFFKKCTTNNEIKDVIVNPFLYIGGCVYLISAILNIIVLRYLPYSVVLPLTSLTYIWSLVISYLFLKERITKVKIYGVLFILLGALLIGI